MPDLYLKKNEDRRLRAGHLWAFSNEVDTRRSPLTDFEPGQAVVLRGADGRPLGVGTVNPASLIACRLLHRDPETVVGPDLLRQRLQRALALRQRLYTEPFYRLCHGEGDFLPGLIVDRFDSLLSVQITTAGMERLKDDVVNVLAELFAPTTLVLRNDTASRTLEGLPAYVETPIGSMPDSVTVRENGLTFTAPFAPERGGQKTGWFFDQRENRQAAARLGIGHSPSPKLTVLDAFSYVGGFGCVAGAARETPFATGQITFLDSSAPALEACAANLAANVPTCDAECLKGDALTELAALHEAGRRFDVVCVDPPAFIKRKKDAAEGLSAYRRVNDLAVRLATDGGIVVSSSCSHHLETGALHRLLTLSAARRGLNAQLVYRGGQGPDHPIHPAMPETAYLKCLIFRLWRD